MSDEQEDVTMPDQTRKLNIPVYDAEIAQEGASHGDDVIDAEVIDAPRLSGEGLRSGFTRAAGAAAGAARSARLNGVRDTVFTQPVDAAREAAGLDDEHVRSRRQGRTRRQDEDRQRRDQDREAKNARAERARLDREAKRDPLAQLRLDTARAGEAYMDSLRRSGILGVTETKETQRKQLSGMHQVYASMMVLQCVQPLQQGISSKSIASVLGTGATMWMLSPNFRTQIGAFAGQMGDALREKFASRGEKKADRARAERDKLLGKGRADQLPNRWQRRLDKIAYAERGHRLPFTAESAAMTEVALAEAAYADMRRPGADPTVIRDRYDSALASLYGYVDDDGVGREEVSRSMRVIVGQRISKEPALANVFSELGHGRFAKSEPREVFITGTTERVTVWTGDFVDSHEGRTISRGSFRLRPAVGVSEHRVLMAETLAAEMTTATSVGDLNDVLSQYVVASSAGQYPDVIDQLEDPVTRTRFSKARTMFASMADDGLSPEEQRFAYTAAYVDAVEATHRVNPEMGRRWAAEYGENWRDDVAEAIRRYNERGAQASTPQSSEKGKTSTPRFTAPPRADGGETPEQQAHVPSPRPDEGHSGASSGERIFTAPRVTRRVLDEPVYIGELDDDPSDGASIIDVEVVEDARELGAPPARRALETAGSDSALGQARDGIVNDLQNRSEQSDYDTRVNLNSTATRVRRALVNQHYNDVETGTFTGIGSDDATPLQDVDFHLG